MYLEKGSLLGELGRDSDLGKLKQDMSQFLLKITDTELEKECIKLMTGDLDKLYANHLKSNPNLFQWYDIEYRATLF